MSDVIIGTRRRAPSEAHQTELDLSPAVCVIALDLFSLVFSPPIG